MDKGLKRVAAEDVIDYFVKQRELDGLEQRIPAIEERTGMRRSGQSLGPQVKMVASKRRYNWNLRFFFGYLSWHVRHSALPALLLTSRKASPVSLWTSWQEEHSTLSW